MKSEQEALLKFKLDYTDRFLNHIEKKMKRGLASEDELAKLNNAEKTFNGYLANGTKLQNKDSIEVVKKYLRLQKNPIFDSLRELLYKKASQTNSKETIILGTKIFNLNAYPHLYTDLVYGQVDVDPIGVKLELEKILHLKLQQDKVRVFKSGREAAEFLKPYGYMYNPILADLNVNSEESVLRIKEIIIECMVQAKRIDNNFDWEVYEEVKNYLPMYHNVNKDLILWLISSFVHSVKVQHPSLKPEALISYYRVAIDYMNRERVR
jgi:hypothetical protein